MIGMIALVVLAADQRRADDPLSVLHRRSPGRARRLPQRRGGDPLMLAFLPALILASRARAAVVDARRVRGLAPSSSPTSRCSPRAAACSSRRRSCWRSCSSPSCRDAVRIWSRSSRSRVGDPAHRPGVLDVGDGARRNGEPGLETVHGSALAGDPGRAGARGWWSPPGLRARCTGGPTADRNYEPPRRIVAASGLAAAVVLASSSRSPPYGQPRDPARRRRWHSFKRGYPRRNAPAAG